MQQALADGSRLGGHHLPQRPPVIGVDFDNTLVDYNAAFYEVGRARDLLSSTSVSGKKAIRDFIRTLPDGEMEWIRTQAAVYGQGISRATLQPGVTQFLRTCRAKGITVYIVSHKTVYPPPDGGTTNLRQVAFQWMRERDFFRSDGLGLLEEHVFFESTRLEKLRRIALLGCTHFIDDLEEVFNEPDFPRGVKKILFLPCAQPSPHTEINIFPSWDAISRAVLP